MSYKPLKLLLRLVGLLVISFSAFCFYLAYWARGLKGFGDASYPAALTIIRYGPVVIPTSPNQAFVMNLNLGIFALVFGVSLFWFGRAIGNKGLNVSQPANSLGPTSKL